MVREPLWLKMGVARTANGIGDTYVEIDYTNQRMWFYKDGQLLVDTQVVTGNTSKDMGSPLGIFALYYKETHAILKGEDYKTPVDFWMPFYGGVGIHDAKWRDSFGGNLYQSSGSHGCINTPWANAKTIYENIDAGTPIVLL
ncbi:MAG: L,D-transpeptidase [Blautia sp.]